MFSSSSVGKVLKQFIVLRVDAVGGTEREEASSLIGILTEVTDYPRSARRMGQPLNLSGNIMNALGAQKRTKEFRRVVLSIQRNHDVIMEASSVIGLHRYYVDDRDPDYMSNCTLNLTVTGQETAELH